MRSWSAVYPLGYDERLIVTRIDIPVEGMQCEGCERAVSMALRRLEGVRDVTADHHQGRVRVSFNPERVDEQRLRTQIEETGYQPS